MSHIKCSYSQENSSYTLHFTSKESEFSVTFKLFFPDNFEYRPVRYYDGFLFAIIFKAMECGEDLYIDLPMTLTGIQNANFYIEAWHNLLPNKYKKINIYASKMTNEVRNTTGEAISAFSGGVDACFTLVRHNEKDWQESSFNIKNVLSVQGFDVPTDKFKEYELLMNRISPIFQQYNCKLFKVWTDLREKSEQDWNMSCSAQLAACLHLLAEHFDQGIIGSGKCYREFFVPSGSTPSTDFLLSSKGMTIVHDGAGFSRTEKVERIYKNKLASDKLKVCWEKGFEDNCGECEKCYRTRLNFLAVGTSNPKCFEGEIELDKIKKLPFHSSSRIVELQSILNYLKKNKIHAPWANKVKYVIFYNIFKLNILKVIYFTRNKTNLLIESIKKLSQ